MSGTLLAGAVCTKATDCKAAKSCCMKVNLKAAGGGTASTSLYCVADGAAAATTVKVTPVADAKSTFVPVCSTATCDGYLTTKCTGVAAGASTLAVSAAVAATAVYMM